MARHDKGSGDRPRDTARDTEWEEAFPAEWATLEEAMPDDPFFAMGAAGLAEAQAEREERQETEEARKYSETDDEREMRGEPPAPAPVSGNETETFDEASDARAGKDAEYAVRQAGEERSGVIQGAIVAVAVIAACVVAVLIVLFMGMARSV